MTNPSQIVPIKPCPFCGFRSEVELAVGEYWVGCQACRNGTKLHASAADAIDDWNRRVDPKPSASDHPVVGCGRSIGGEAVTPEIIQRIRDVAKEHGWAIGTHGSLVRDIDLIGVPWTADATAPEILVGAILRTIGYTTHGHTLGHPRPGGRRSILMMHPNATFEQTEKGTWTPPAIDLSLMPSFAHCLSYVSGAPNPKITGPAPEVSDV